MMCNWIARGGHDTVVLASVVQYFPGIEYLLSVLDGIFGRALAPGGSVFVGDVRSLPLLEAFHASVQLHKADAADSAAALADRVRQRLAREQELAIDPVFFLALRQRYPAIRTVEILPKRGTAANEMTRFRYDVLIRTAGDGRARQMIWRGRIGTRLSTTSRPCGERCRIVGPPSWRCGASPTRA